MIKNSEFDFAYDYLRFDTTWLFEWDVKNITSNTIKLYPFTEQGVSRTWKFTGNNTATIKTVDADVWNPEQPYLQYDAADPASWDREHLLNPTRYLSPGSSFITLTNTVETVVIDNVPPAFVSDRGTEYVWISNITGKDKGGVDESRHCEFVFRDEAGLDYKHFAISVGKPADESGTEISDDEWQAQLEAAAKKANDAGGELDSEDPIFANLIYYYSRRYDLAIINSQYIDADTLKVSSDGYLTYKIQFDIMFATNEEYKLLDGTTAATGSLPDVNCQRLNDEGIRIKVFDVAGNSNTYCFKYFEKDDVIPDDGNNYINRKWILIDSIDDLTDLEPCQIKFYDPEPGNRIIDEHTSGQVWVSVYNPNKDFWCLKLKSELIRETSLGQIDMETLDESEYETAGIIKFRVSHIQQHGTVDVRAYIITGNKLFDDMLVNATLAEASYGPWIVKDLEGRQYNIQRYVPNYLKNTDFAAFIEFFELYLNTLYTNLTKGTNISILEKIAKIGNFNDIDRLEHALVWHYAKDFGSEYDIDLDTMLKLNLGFFSDAKTDRGIFNSRTENDVIDILKYALKQLPYYNQVKGSEKGIVMALKMFSFSCRVINLWVKLENQVEENPDFVEEDRMQDFSSHFLTSRFNIELNSLTADFPTFNDNIHAFIKFVKSVKPIVRILNLIKYTIIFEYDYYWLVNDYAHDDMPGHIECCYTYHITWNADEIAEMIERSKVDWKVMHANRIWLNYNCDNCIVDVACYDPITKKQYPMSEYLLKYGDEYREHNHVDLVSLLPENPPELHSCYTLFASYIANSLGKMTFRYNNPDLDIAATMESYTIKQGSMVRKKTLECHVGNQIRITWADDPSNPEIVDFGEKPNALTFIKRFSLNDVDVHMLDTGFYMYPKTGELATYLAEFVKPTYWVNDKLKDWQKTLTRYMNDNYAIIVEVKNDKGEWELIKCLDSSSPDYDSDWKYIYLSSWDVEHDNATMDMKIEHVPGTEIFRSVTPE